MEFSLWICWDESSNVGRWIQDHENVIREKFLNLMDFHIVE